MNLKNGKVFRSKFVGTGPSSYEKRIYRAAVSQSLRNIVIQYLVTATYSVCDDTRCCIIKFDLLMMSTIVLETCRGMY